MQRKSSVSTVLDGADDQVLIASRRSWACIGSNSRGSNFPPQWSSNARCSGCCGPRIASRNSSYPGAPPMSSGGHPRAHQTGITVKSGASKWSSIGSKKTPESACRDSARLDWPLSWCDAEAALHVGRRVTYEGLCQAQNGGISRGRRSAHPHEVALHFTHFDQLMEGLAHAGVRQCRAHNRAGFSNISIPIKAGSRTRSCPCLGATEGPDLDRTILCLKLGHDISQQLLP